MVTGPTAWSAAPAATVAEPVPADAPFLAAVAALDGIDPATPAGRLLTAADDLTRRGTKYRRLRTERRLGPADVPASPGRLSCSEFVWIAARRAGIDVGDRPTSSRRLASTSGRYSGAFTRVTDGTLLPGDLLVYGPPGAPPSSRGRAPRPVSHVVILVSPRTGLVVGSHGRESTPAGTPRGAGYRRLVGSLTEWPGGRTLQAVYRIRADVR